MYEYGMHLLNSMEEIILRLLPQSQQVLTELDMGYNHIKPLNVDYNKELWC